MTPTLKEQIEQWIERETKKRSLRQCSTGLKSLDEALQWHIEVGFESGAHSILPMLVVAVEALEFDCGNKCNAEYNPCNAKEALNKIKSMMEGKGNE